MRQAEVQNLDLVRTVTPGQKHIGRLQIQVKNPVPMCMVDCDGNRVQHRQSGLGRQRTGRPQSLRERFTFQVLGNQIGNVTLRIDAVIGHVDDVRMLDASQRFGLDAKSM